MSKDIFSKINIPQYNCSAVDGYAIKYQDLEESENRMLKLIGKNSPGSIFKKTISKKSTIGIFTGAPIPDYYDTVVMFENCTVNDREISFPQDIVSGQNYRKKGEDIRLKSKVFNKGHVLKSQDLGQLAAIGLSKVSVFKTLKVGILSTGNELQDPGFNLNISERDDSNRYFLYSSLKKLNCLVSDLGLIKDDKRIIEDVIHNSSKTFDLLITSGSASSGEEDYINTILSDIGKIYISRVKIKPGKPLVIGKIGKCTFLGLPGNSVAMFSTYLRIIRPLILKISGAINYLPNFYFVESGFEYSKKSSRTELLRVTLLQEKGKNIALLHEKQSTGIFQSIIESEGFVELDEDVNYISKGMIVKYIPFNEV